jgi:Holliday junction DNA helicase RuvB
VIPRPNSFETFLGQTAAIEHLKVSTRAAKRLGRPHGHVLFTGAPGLGKSTLASYVLPAELGSQSTVVNCASIEKPADLLPTLSTVKQGQVLVLDEIHCLLMPLKETLYSVMQDSVLPIVLGEGDKRQVLNLTLPAFTLVGCTTRDGLLPIPLLDRFKHTIRLESYTDREMIDVLTWMAQNSEAEAITGEAAAVLATACHGTARHAGRLIESCVETAAAGGLPTLAITREVAVSTLTRLRYAPTGLSAAEVQLLDCLAGSSRGTMGLNTLASVMDEEALTVSEIYLPWLLKSGYIETTPAGRTITEKGRQVLAASKV